MLSNNKLCDLPKIVLGKFLSRGLAGLDTLIDWHLGISTIGRFHPASVDSELENMEHAKSYRATPHHVINLALKALRTEFGPFSFVDVGSGKGRVVLQASKYPFHRVLGVEFSPSLHAIALKNAAQARLSHQAKSKIKFYCLDALQLELPREPLVIFYFNSFKPPVLSKFLVHVIASLKSNPRDCLFIYVNPVDRNCIDVLDEFERIRVPAHMALTIRLLSPWDVIFYRYQLCKRPASDALFIPQ